MPSPASLVQAIKRGLDVPAATAEQLANAIVPVLSVGSVARWYENTSREKRPFLAWAQRSGVASNYLMIALVNPEANGQYVVVEQMRTLAGGVYAIEIMTSTEAEVLATGSPLEISSTLKGFCDTRGMACDGTSADRPSFKIYDITDTVQAGGNRLFRQHQASTAANETFDLGEGILLEPGKALVVVNTTLGAGFTNLTFRGFELRIPR